MSVWEEIKDKVSIEDILADYVKLKPKGRDFVCNCPFHKEKTPSLSISTSKQIWHCFGCGLGGDIFKFVSLIENLTQRETLDKLASRTGVELEKYSKKQVGNTTNQSSESNTVDITKTERQQGFEFLSWTANIYHQALLKTLQDPTNPVTMYCFERGLTLEIIKKFKMGFAPNQDLIYNFIKDKPDLVDIGIKTSVLKQVNYN
jgi:DNA primase